LSGSAHDTQEDELDRRGFLGRYPLPEILKQGEVLKMQDDLNPLTPYEKSQVKEITKWKKEEPGVVSKAFGIALEPLAWLIKQVVPEAAMRGALDFSCTAAQWMTDTKDVMRDGGVRDLGELKLKDLHLSDRLADEVHNWAIGIGVVEGAGTGVIGLPGMAADIPAIITLALRTVHKIGICYGYESTSENDKNFALGIMAASGANSVAEKTASLATLRSIEVTIAKTTWKRMAEKAATERLSREGAIRTIKNLAKQLGINLTKRKALAAIPFIGAAVGGSVNGWYIKEVGWAARRAFQERWLIDNHKVIEI
jgi:hypothetical protein